MTDLDELEKVRARKRAWLAANAERMRQWQIEYQKTNAARLKERRTEYLKANAERHRAANRAWEKENPEKARESNRRRVGRYQAKYPDCVVLRSLTAGTSIRPQDVPSELIELKRAQLKLARILREKRRECKDGSEVNN